MFRERLNCFGHPNEVCSQGLRRAVGRCAGSTNEIFRSAVYDEPMGEIRGVIGRGDNPLGFIAAFLGKKREEVEWVTQFDTLEKAEAERDRLRTLREAKREAGDD